MPSCTFSIIVPVHNVRAYLRECLDSILGQSFADFEVIAVDDASPDGSGQILDDYATDDVRLTVLHLERNVGLGRARNAGMDAARGRYLLFVDGDDTLVPGALAAIAGQIAATSDPDILLFDYARTYWTGSVERNILGGLYDGFGTRTVDVDSHPELLTLLMVVWNKAYRRDFIEEHGFRCPVGYYEDLPWTYPTMITARRIAVLDQVCYLYRQRRHGNILRSSNRRHFDIFEQYGRVFAYLDANPELERWRTFMFDRMTVHLLQILTNRQRIAPALQKEFFTAFAAAYQRYRPGEHRLPVGRSGTKLRTVARNNYPEFLALYAASRAERFARRHAARTRTDTNRQITRVKRALIRAYYHACLRLPVDEGLAAYAAYWFRDYACNPAAIYAAAKRLAPGIRGVWVIRPEYVDLIPPGVDHVELGSPEYYRLMATAKYFVNNVNFPDNIVKRPGTVHVQTKHGTPLKTMGLALRDYPTGAANMNFSSLMRNSDRWDYVISSNRFSSEVWERSFPNSYVTLEIGYPRNDRLVRATPDEVARMRERLGIEPGKTAVLYAPTFRDWRRNEFDSPADLADLGERLGEDFVVLVRAHYFTRGDRRLERLEQRGLLRGVSEYPVVEDLMLAADVLVTDYSSIMFDYANLDRPIVIFAPDWDTYARVRGVNFDLMQAPPGVVETTQPGLIDALRSGRYDDSTATARRKDFMHRFCQLDDGYASERLVNQVFLGGRSEHSMPATGVAQNDAGPQGDWAEEKDRVEETDWAEDGDAD